MNIFVIDLALSEGERHLISGSLYFQEFTSVEHFVSELHAYIEWYNTKRIKLRLGGMSPVISFENE